MNKIEKYKTALEELEKAKQIIENVAINYDIEHRYYDMEHCCYDIDDCLTNLKTLMINGSQTQMQAVSIVRVIL